jgi:glucosamine-6-phosphate deaminase
LKQHVYPDYGALCIAVSDQVVRQLKRKPGSVLVFPTGNTPLGLFKKLVELKKAGSVDFSQAHIVVLDEYAGLAEGDPRSLADWLKRELLSPAGVRQSHIHGFGHGPAALEEKIASLGGLDLVVLGLGPNGHLGFNEPGSPFDSRARMVDLAHASIISNAAYWGSEDRVPKQGYTLGLGTIREAQTIILLVSGAGKNRILNAILSSKVTLQLPATVLKGSANAHLYSDAAAMYGS